MTTAHTDPRPGLAVARAPMLLTGVVGATVAAVLNTALWAAGRAADASFSVTPVGTDTPMDVGVGLVLIGTVAGFGTGWALLAAARRRGATWVRAVLTTAAVVAVASVAGPLGAADETGTGLLLAAMHLVTGAVFLVAARQVDRR